MKVLVTGADGFVGAWVLRRLLVAGDEVLGAMRAGSSPPALLTPSERQAVQWLSFDLADPASFRLLADQVPDVVLHLAALASGSDARQDPGLAWNLNAAGSARLVDALARSRQAGTGDPRVLLVSSGEVYGDQGPSPRVETDPLLPCNPYAASKVGAEIAGLETWRRTGLRVLIARPFTHTGPGQLDQYVAAAFAKRLAMIRRTGAPAVKVGNLDPVRDFLDVRDVVEAYLALLHRGQPGEVYNIGSGQGIALADLFQRLAAVVGVRAIPETDASLIRGSDIRHLVGDASKLRAATGWAPRIPLEQTLRDLVDAQAD
jgi:GDP-4-dehydro-6-deoxy-D-mannose reductase